MKKVVYSIAAAALLVPLIAGAVTWTGDSNQFRWKDGSPTLGDNNRAASHVTLQYRPELSRGTVTILYNLPPRVQGAKLFIYDVSGSLVRNFALEPGRGTVQWKVADERVAAGVYVAFMKYGMADKKIKIAIVK